MEQSQHLTVNKPLSSPCEDMLADDSAPESEYDTKSLKRKKKQNKIRRWAMDKLVKRGIAKDTGAVVKEIPSIVSEGDDISITSRDVPLARTLPLRERKGTYSVGELPPPKPPRTRKIKSVVMETSVTEPLLSSEDPVSEEWYKSGSLFETDFCDSIMEVIKNIGYTCDSPSSSMMQSDGEVPSTDNPVLGENNRCDDVIANGNVLESGSPTSKTLAAETQDLTDGPIDKPLTIETRNLSVKNQSDDRFNEEIPDEFQCYNGDNKASTENIHEDASLSLPTPATKVLREKSVSASDVSLEFFSAHSSPINSIDNCGSPVQEISEPVMVTKKPAQKLDTTAWVSEESSNEGNSSTNLRDSPPLSKSSIENVSPHCSTDETHVVTRNSPNVEISEAGEVNKDSEPSSTPGEPDTGPSYTVIKTNIDTDVSSSTLVGENASTEEVTSSNPDVMSSNPEMTSSNQEGKSSNQEATSSNPEVKSPVTSAVKINNDTTSPMTSSVLALPEAASGDPFTSDEELDDNGRPSSAPEPIIIPLSKTAHEVWLLFIQLCCVVLCYV